MDDISAKFEADRTRTRAASSGAVEARSFRAAASIAIEAVECRFRAELAQNSRRQIAPCCAVAEFSCAYCARALRACANSCFARQKISPMRAARVRAARVRALVFQLPVSHNEFISTNFTLSGGFKVVKADGSNLDPAADIAFVSI